MVNLFLDFLEERLEHHGWKLVWEMSHAWITSLDLLDETPTEQVHEATPFERIKMWHQGVGVGCGWRVQHLHQQKNADGGDGRKPAPRGVAAADQVSGS